MRNHAEKIVSDLLGSEWLYESEILYVPYKYKPDFYHPPTGTMLEVKGVADSLDRLKFHYAQSRVQSNVVTVLGSIPPVLENELVALLSKHGFCADVKQQPRISRYIVAPFVPHSVAQFHNERKVYNESISKSSLSGRSLCSWLQTQNIPFVPFSAKFYDRLRVALGKIEGNPLQKPEIYQLDKTRNVWYNR